MRLGLRAIEGRDGEYNPDLKMVPSKLQSPRLSAPETSLQKSLLSPKKFEISPPKLLLSHSNRNPRLSRHLCSAGIPARCQGFARVAARFSPHLAGPMPALLGRSEKLAPSGTHDASIPTLRKGRGATILLRFIRLSSLANRLSGRGGDWN